MKSCLSGFWNMFIYLKLQHNTGLKPISLTYMWKLSWGFHNRRRKKQAFQTKCYWLLHSYISADLNGVFTACSQRTCAVKMCCMQICGLHATHSQHLQHPGSRTSHTIIKQKEEVRAGSWGDGDLFLFLFILLILLHSWMSRFLADKIQKYRLRVRMCSVCRVQANILSFMLYVHSRNDWMNALKVWSMYHFKPLKVQILHQSIDLKMW